jgi:hypothetical protein
MTIRAEGWAVLSWAILQCGASGQTLTGTVTGADTGAGIPGATVNAFLRVADQGHKPVVYQGQTDAAGRYGITVSPGTYTLCVQGANAYLDPCQWGGASSVAVAAGGTVSAPLRLEKGAPFVLRVHDKNRLLQQVERIKGEAVSAAVTTPSGRRFLLPLAYDNGRIRDYAANLPRNVALTLSVGSVKLALSDRANTPLNANGISFQVSDPPSARADATTIRRFAPLPDATFIHVNVTGRSAP